MEFFALYLECKYTKFKDYFQQIEEFVYFVVVM